MKAFLIPLLLVVAPAFAQDPTATTATPGTNTEVQPAAAAPVAKEAAKEKKRCKRSAAIGSRLGKTVCHTEEEWALIEQNAKEFARTMGNTPVQMNEESIYGGAASGGNCQPKCPY